MGHSVRRARRRLPLLSNADPAQQRSFRLAQQEVNQRADRPTHHGPTHDIEREVRPT